MENSRHLRRRVAAASVTITVLGIAPAAAHAVLVDSQPAEGQRVVEQLDAVVLSFSEPVDPAEVTVTTPEGVDVAEGPPEQVDESVHQPVGRFPEQGSYTIRYRVLSLDDHTITGEVTFVYAGSAEPDADEPDADQQDSVTPGDPPGPGDRDGPTRERPLVLRLWPLLLLALAAAAGIAVAARAFRSTRTSTDDR